MKGAAILTEDAGNPLGAGDGWMTIPSQKTTPFITGSRLASTSATESNGNKVLGPRPRVRPTGLHHCTGKKKQSDGLGVNMGCRTPCIRQVRRTPAISIPANEEP